MLVGHYGVKESFHGLRLTLNTSISAVNRLCFNTFSLMHAQRIMNNLLINDSTDKLASYRGCLCNVCIHLSIYLDQF